MNIKQEESIPTLKVLDHQDDRAALRRFWYDTYVTEMGRDTDIADHKNGELNDPRIEHAIVIVAYEDDKIVGTLLCTPSWTNALGKYEDLYSMSKLGPCHPNTSGIITKLMVAPKYRSTLLSVLIAKKLYRTGVPMGIQYVLIDCNDYLAPYFEALGFKAWGDPVVHPSYGEVHVMKLDCLDLPHLESVQSPILSVAREVAPTALALPFHLRKAG